MSSHLAPYLTNNDLPSESVIREIKKAMEEPVAELSRSEVEIERLERHLQELRRTHDGIKTSLNPYYIVLSPIRRVPPDILREIFFHCLPTQRNSIMSSTDAPILVTHICRTWRETALTSPRIWAKIHIPFLETMPRPDTLLTQPDADTLRHAEVMDQRCAVVEEWLSRSGDCPLSISLYYVHRNSDFRPSTNQLKDHPASSAQRVLNTILPLAKRWKDIQLSIPSEFYEKIQAKISPDMVPMLQTLKITFNQRINRNLRQGPIVFIQAPNLQKLSIASIEISKFKNITASLQKLTVLNWHSAFSHTKLLDLLRMLPNLVHFQSFLISSESDNQNHAEPVAVSLPSLQSLCLVDGGSFEAAEKMYDFIDAPLLTWVDYRRHPFYPHSSPDYVLNGIPLPVLPLLQKSVRVKKLTLEQFGLRKDDIIKSFHLVPSLSHLIMGDKVLHTVRLAGNRSVGKSLSESLDLNLLIIEEHSSREEILLPNLIAFEAHWAWDLEDETLLRFITSRLNPAAQNGVACLKFVHVTFARVKQRDISEEVYRCAKAAGVELKLELVYQPIRQEKYLEPLSSSYGLTVDGNSTWYNRDIDGSEVIFS